jgi:polysaccharide export outer membrane protein
MKINGLKKFFFFVVLLSFFGCRYNSNIMLKTGSDYPYDNPPINESMEYIISPSDILEFRLYTNNGSAIVDFTAIEGGGGGGGSNISLSYLVENDGKVKLPVLGRVELKGLTIKEVEELLEEHYEKYYIKPFVQVQVTNKRITVFPGGSSKAQVIPLINNNMNLLEALASVGGLPELAKANRIKLVRGNLSNPKVYMFDFKTIEGIKQADFVLQANDIIYVEPRVDYYNKVIRDIMPIIGLTVSLISFVILISSLGNNN